MFEDYPDILSPEEAAEALRIGENAIYELLFGNTVNQSAWSDTTSKISQLDVAYKESIDKTLQGILELITKAKQGPNRS